MELKSERNSRYQKGDKKLQTRIESENTRNDRNKEQLFNGQRDVKFVPYPDVKWSPNIAKKFYCSAALVKTAHFVPSFFFFFFFFAQTHLIFTVAPITIIQVFSTQENQCKFHSTADQQLFTCLLTCKIGLPQELPELMCAQINPLLLPLCCGIGTVEKICCHFFSLARIQSDPVLQVGFGTRPIH